MGKPKKGKFVMSYNNGNNNRKFNNNRNNNRNGNNFNNRNNRNNSQNIKKQEIIEKQNKSLDMIESAAEFLDNAIASTSLADSNTFQKLTMKEILTYLINDKGFAQDDTKTVSQYNYILMDLANAQRSGYISGNRINIRILYIQERLKTSFKKELHSRVDKIMETYANLFMWNEEDKEESDINIAIEEENKMNVSTDNINIEIPSTTTDVKSIDIVTTEETKNNETESTETVTTE